MKHTPPPVADVRYFTIKTLKGLRKKMEIDAAQFRPAATEWLDALQSWLAYKLASEGVAAMIRSAEEGTLDAMLTAWIEEAWAEDPRTDRDQT